MARVAKRRTRTDVANWWVGVGGWCVGSGGWRSDDPETWDMGAEAENVECYLMDGWCVGSGWVARRGGKLRSAETTGILFSKGYRLWSMDINRTLESAVPTPYNGMEITIP